MKKWALLALLLTMACSSSPKSKPAAPLPHAAVVSYHPLATQIGEKILTDGGNAFDAFVATTAAEYVLGEGVTSIGGPLGALLFDAKAKQAVYLDAEFNEPLHPGTDHRSPGSQALVPGAIAGLEALSQRYGHLPFAQVLQPAIDLARAGFPLNHTYAVLLKVPAYQRVLKRSQYGRDTFFKNGEPLKEGDRLRLPVLADFLEKLAKNGSIYAYQGAWSKNFLKTVNRHGGHFVQQDLSSYRVAWREPWSTTYRGIHIFAPSGRTFGGLLALIALNTLSHTVLAKFEAHYSQSAEALELLVRIRNEVAAESFAHDPTRLDDASAVANLLSSEHADEIWSRVQEKLAVHRSQGNGTHSYQIVVVDRDGNAITGTNTIESLPWAAGLFVEGVPLTASGVLPFATRPGERRLSPLSMEIGVKDDKVQFASGAFGLSLTSAAFQFLINIVDYKMNAHDAANTPRFGEEAWDLQSDLKHPTHFNGLWLDSRIDPKIVQALEERGLSFYQKGYVDTGLGAIAIVHADGGIDSAIAALPAPPKRQITGVGILFEPQGDYLIVKAMTPKAPASASGRIQIGDELIAVQPNPEQSWIDAKGHSVEEMVPLIRGAVDSIVHLKLRRSGQEYTVELQRRPVSN